MSDIGDPYLLHPINATTYPATSPVSGSSSISIPTNPNNLPGIFVFNQFISYQAIAIVVIIVVILFLVLRK